MIKQLFDDNFLPPFFSSLSFLYAKYEESFLHTWPSFFDEAFCAGDLFSLVLPITWKWIIIEHVSHTEHASIEFIKKSRMDNLNYLLPVYWPICYYGNPHYKRHKCYQKQNYPQWCLHFDLEHKNINIWSINWMHTFGFWNDQHNFDSVNPWIVTYKICLFFSLNDFIYLL